MVVLKSYKYTIIILKSVSGGFVLWMYTVRMITDTPTLRMGKTEERSYPFFLLPSR